MTLLVNNPGHVRRVWLAQEYKMPYVTADKILMVAAEKKSSWSEFKLSNECQDLQETCLY